MTRATALVTGAGRGIGEAIAQRLAGDGFRVAVNDRDATAAARVATEIDGLAVPGDVSDPAHADRMVAQAVDDLGSLAVLVNNAGVEQRASLQAHDLAAWERVMDVNLTGPFLVSRAAAPALASAAGGGCIVNIGSTAVVGFSGQIAYDASKGGVVTLTRSLAVELGRDGIRANAVCPGFIATEMVKESGLESIGAKVTAKNPIPRMGLPHEVAAAVSFLASREAGYITGQALFVDGGWIRC